MVHARAVRFRNTTFARNAAKAGGAIFTNNLTMITIVPDVEEALETSVTYELDYVLTKNETQHLEACNVSFHENSVAATGYGEKAASTPFTAFLVNLDGEGGQDPEETFANSSFLSGDRLRFDVVFRDGLGEAVTFADNLTARISCDEERSKNASANCSKLEISGQETAQASEDGVMQFTAVRLRGLRKKTYVLRIDYRSMSELQTLNVDSSFIRVTMRPCKIGERTVSQDGDYLECQECGQGEFQPFPDRHECLCCDEAENHTQCDGKTIVPRDGYWHATSYSFAAQECIGHDACKSSKEEGKTRTEKLREIAREAHERDEFLLHNFSQNSTLCGKVRRRFASPWSHLSLCTGLSRCSLRQLREWLRQRRERLPGMRIACYACPHTDDAHPVVVSVPHLFHSIRAAAGRSHRLQQKIQSNENAAHPATGNAFAVTYNAAHHSTGIQPSFERRVQDGAAVFGSFPRRMAANNGQ